MYYALFGIHLIIAFLICVVVLLQRSKGNGLAGAFGGVGAGEAMFGSHGVTTFLHKATIYLAIGFMVTSLGLAYLTAIRSDAPAPGAVRGETVLPVAGDAAGLDASAIESVPVTELPEGDGIVPNVVPAPTETEEGGSATEGDASDDSSAESAGGNGASQDTTRNGTSGGGR